MALDVTMTEGDLDQIEQRLRGSFASKDDFNDFKSEILQKLQEIERYYRDIYNKVDEIKYQIEKIEENLPR